MPYRGYVDENPPIAQLSSPPPFTGTLELSLNMETVPAISQLLSLPGGLHFRELHRTFFCFCFFLPKRHFVNGGVGGDVFIYSQNSRD